MNGEPDRLLIEARRDMRQDFVPVYLNNGDTLQITLEAQHSMVVEGVTYHLRGPDDRS